MTASQRHTHNHPHRGTFAEGEAMPERYADEDHVGSFADGQGRS
jgi:hypothetical protein